MRELLFRAVVLSAPPTHAQEDEANKQTREEAQELITGDQSRERL